VSGLAGMLLGALAAERCIGHEVSLTNRIVVELVNRGVTPAGTHGTRAWAFDGRFMSGVSHGSAGAILALASFGQSRPEHAADIAGVVEAAILYEDSDFDQKVGNWPDRRFSRTPPVYQNAWCHGALGIVATRGAVGTLLKRQFGIPVLGIPTAFSRMPRGEPACYCCGLAGRLDVCMRMGAAKEDLGLWREELCDTDGLQLGPGFFQGRSGIGFALLRQKLPSLPCVGIFELPDGPARD
jgi:lantibiotic modifying enzyme